MKEPAAGNRRLFCGWLESVTRREFPSSTPWSCGDAGATARAGRAGPGATRPGRGCHDSGGCSGSDVGSDIGSDIGSDVGSDVGTGAGAAVVVGFVAVGWSG